MIRVETFGLWTGIITGVLAIPLAIVANILTPFVLEHVKLSKAKRCKALSARIKHFRRLMHHTARSKALKRAIFCMVVIIGLAAATIAASFPAYIPVLFSAEQGGGSTVNTDVSPSVMTILMLGIEALSIAAYCNVRKASYKHLKKKLEDTVFKHSALNCG
jgi:hypothetical protein